MPFPLIPAIGALSGVTSAIGSIFGVSSQAKANARQEAFAREMWDAQGKRELDFWNMSNQYNSPQAQMQRLEAAGINPRLAFSNGTVDNQGGALRAGGAPATPSFRPLPLGSVVSNSLGAVAQMAQIKQTEAQTDAIKQQNAIGQFDLVARQELGQSKITRALDARVTRATSDDVKAIRQFDAWLNIAHSTGKSSSLDVDQFGTFPAGGSTFVDSEVKNVALKYMAEIDNIRSSTALRDQQKGINELQKVILRAEADFTRMVGSAKGAGFALQLLRTILGK